MEESAPTSPRATGKWCQPGVPHKGWACIGDVEDLEEPSAICEMCEVMEIRYVHHMVHSDYPEPLLCGCICAGHMSEDLAGARKREADFKKAASSASAKLRREERAQRKAQEAASLRGFRERMLRKEWPNLEWLTSSRGNPYINVRVNLGKVKRLNLVVFEQGTGFRVRVEDRRTGERAHSGAFYTDWETAKSGALEVVLAFDSSS